VRPCARAARALLDPRPAAHAAVLLVGHDQHLDRADALGARAQRASDRVHGHHDAGLHVPHARTAKHSVATRRRPLRRRARRPHGVGVAYQQQTWPVTDCQRRRQPAATFARQREAASSEQLADDADHAIDPRRVLRAAVDPDELLGLGDHRVGLATQLVK
jgi:hypothetical protein